MSDTQKQQYSNQMKGVRTYARDMEEMKNSASQDTNNSIPNTETKNIPAVQIAQKQTANNPITEPKKDTTPIKHEQPSPIGSDNLVTETKYAKPEITPTPNHLPTLKKEATKPVSINEKDTTDYQQTQNIPEDTREQVLERLRAKVSEHTKPTERLVEKSVLPKQTHERPNLIQLPNIQPEHKERVVSPIHTYKSDFTDYVHETNASETQMLATEQDSINHSKQKVKSNNNIWFAIGGVAFIILSISGLWYAYSYNSKLSAPVATKTTAPTLVFVDSQQELFGSGDALVNALAQSSNKPLAEGSMRLTYISVATSTILGATTTAPASGGYLIAALGLPMPEILMRNISLNSTVGVIHAGTQTRPFFVMKVASYDAAFAGMLRWEKTIGNDMRLLYPEYKTAFSTTSATSTQFTAAPSFVDKIITNHDVRVLSGSDGRSILMYGFWNKNTLIIARDAKAFIEISNRLGNLNTQ